MMKMNTEVSERLGLYYFLVVTGRPNPAQKGTREGKKKKRYPPPSQCQYVCPICGIRIKAECNEIFNEIKRHMAMHKARKKKKEKFILKWLKWFRRENGEEDENS